MIATLEGIATRGKEAGLKVGADETVAHFPTRYRGVVCGGLSEKMVDLARYTDE